MSKDDGRFNKGQIPWNKGKSTPEHVKKKQSEVKKGKTAWNKGTGTCRSSFVYKEWRMKVLERDGNKCIECHSEDNLHCDHIVSWKESEELRFEVSNGQTLCRSCHLKKSIEHGEVTGTPFLKGDTFWKGKKRSEETKKKISETKKGVKLSEETKNKMKGRIHSEDTRQKMRDAHKRRAALKKCKEA